MNTPLSLYIKNIQGQNIPKQTENQDNPAITPDTPTVLPRSFSEEDYLPNVTFNTMKRRKVRLRWEIRRARFMEKLFMAFWHLGQRFLCCGDWIRLLPVVNSLALSLSLSLSLLLSRKF